MLEGLFRRIYFTILGRRFRFSVVSVCFGMNCTATGTIVNAGPLGLELIDEDGDRNLIPLGQIGHIMIGPSVNARFDFRAKKSVERMKAMREQMQAAAFGSSPPGAPTPAISEDEIKAELERQKQERKEGMANVLDGMFQIGPGR